jgi:hypothetical protein
VQTDSEDEADVDMAVRLQREDDDAGGIATQRPRRRAASAASQKFKVCQLSDALNTLSLQANLGQGPIGPKSLSYTYMVYKYLCAASYLSSCAVRRSHLPAAYIIHFTVAE